MDGRKQRQRVQTLVQDLLDRMDREQTRGWSLLLHVARPYGRPRIDWDRDPHFSMRVGEGLLEGRAVSDETGTVATFRYGGRWANVFLSAQSDLTCPLELAKIELRTARLGLPALVDA